MKELLHLFDENLNLKDISKVLRALRFYRVIEQYFEICGKVVTWNICSCPEHLQVSIQVPHGAVFFFDEKDTVLNRHCRSCGFSCPVLRAVTKTSSSSVLATLLFLLSACFHHRDVNTAPQPGAINSIFHSIMWVSAFAVIAVLSGGQAQIFVPLLHKAKMRAFIQYKCTDMSFVSSMFFYDVTIQNYWNGLRCRGFVRL